jgi:hypothetical protein
MLTVALRTSSLAIAEQGCKFDFLSRFRRAYGIFGFHNLPKVESGTVGSDCNSRFPFYLHLSVRHDRVTVTTLVRMDGERDIFAKMTLRPCRVLFNVRADGSNLRDKQALTEDPTSLD